jgi:DNA-binding CsgD family transcriptional regulator
MIDEIFDAHFNSTDNAHPTPPTTEVAIRVASDGDASRITAVLEALGYVVVRDLTNYSATLAIAAGRLAQRHKLTTRERQILERVLNGDGNEQIARMLELSRPTVKWHMHNIFAKTCVTSRENLLRLALQLPTV